MYLFKKLFNQQSPLEKWPFGEVSIRKEDPEKQKLLARWGKKGSSPGCLNMPSGIAVNKRGVVISLVPKVVSFDIVLVWNITS